MKKFIFGLVMFASGIFLTSAGLVAEGSVIGGYNATGDGIANLYNLNDHRGTIIILIAGILMALIGLVLSVISIMKDPD